MFSYYGGKSRVARYYPKPSKDIDLLIEPFAGGAQYAVLHFNKQVELYDINPTVVRVWQYLIAATKNDILMLPKKVTSDIPNLRLDPLEEAFLGTVWKGDNEHHNRLLSQAEQDLLGFCWARGNATPCKNAGLFSDGWENKQRRIAEFVTRIKHWKITESSYLNLDTSYPATWFIDPPYQIAGSKYQFSNIHYPTLLEWLQKLKGKMILCENEDAKWLDMTTMQPLVRNQGGKKTKMEYFKTWKV